MILNVADACHGAQPELRLLRFEYEGLAGARRSVRESDLWNRGSQCGSIGTSIFVDSPDQSALSPELHRELVTTLLDVPSDGIRDQVEVPDPLKQRDPVDQTQPRLLTEQSGISTSCASWCSLTSHTRVPNGGESSGLFISYGTRKILATLFKPAVLPGDVKATGPADA